MTQAAATVSTEVSDLARVIEHHLKYSLGRRPQSATAYELFRALGLAVRPYVIDRLVATQERYEKEDVKRVYYLSMEFLIGQSLRNNLHNLGIFDVCQKAAAALGTDLDAIAAAEPDAALGNGGLGRLAACFLESLATLGMPGYGYGINYDFGLFKQEIDDGYQKEEPDPWLSEESPWIINRPDQAWHIPVYGRVEHGRDRHGDYNPMWLDWKVLIGVPNDIPVVGYGGRTINLLRLYSARASEVFDIRIFNQGDYLRAIEEKIDSEKVSKVLYPSDSIASGRELRLIQEYFMVACAIRDSVRRFLERHEDFRQFPDKVAIQMNDTHPALAVAELMRLLIDERDLPWEDAWDVTCATCGYTNHTLMPEALEKWPVDLVGHVLPRHLQIIYEINHRFLKTVAAKWPGDDGRARELSLIQEEGGRQVRMAHLAIVGSHAVNGVAALHSELVKSQLVPGFHALWPKKFQNKTNGVTHRRWLAWANPELAQLITRTIGDAWITDLSQLKQLEPLADNTRFQEEFAAVKRGNKQRLAEVARETAGVIVNPASIFDVHVKRMHEYKRQLLNVMSIIHEYLSLVDSGDSLAAPVTFLFAGKAAPGYMQAKLIIKLIHSVAAIVNNDPRVNGQLCVAFLPDYKVSLAEKIIPAADISEQISTAGMEASGTGNMKLSMNGALTLGTLDGANVEIQEEVGHENIYIFGFTAAEIQSMRSNGSYDPGSYYRDRPTVRRVVDAIGSDLFCPHEPGLFQSIYHALIHHGDHYFHLADLESYIAMKRQAVADYTDASLWSRKAILNVARMAKFSSDRTIKEYAREIWNL